jgi:hypothetical protein
MRRKKAANRQTPDGGHDIKRVEKTLLLDKI